MRTKKNPFTRVALYLFVFVICIIILYPRSEERRVGKECL